MASSGKRKTTRAKLTRESKLLEKRGQKEARKAARREAAAEGPAEPESSDETYFGRLAEDPTRI
jgi:hypothetical protein